jgi:hypothetical protein
VLKFEMVVLSRLKIQTGFLRQSTRTNCPSSRCHGSKFDLAGRVYTGVPAPINLMIPPYHFVSNTLIQIGVSPKEHEIAQGGKLVSNQGGCKHQQSPQC